MTHDPACKLRNNTYTILRVKHPKPVDSTFTQYGIVCCETDYQYLSVAAALSLSSKH